MTLVEIAPGIDLQTQVLDLMDFVPAVSPDLRTMPAGIFREQWDELASLVRTTTAPLKG